MQVRHLLLDPAVKREFERLQSEVEAKAREAKGLQEELQAVHFSQDSKSGRMLMAKCRALQVDVFHIQYKRTNEREECRRFRPRSCEKSSEDIGWHPWKVLES